MASHPRQRNDQGEVVDQYSVSVPTTLSDEGYRLVWYHSTLKAQPCHCAASASRASVDRIGGAAPQALIPCGRAIASR